MNASPCSAETAAAPPIVAGSGEGRRATVLPSDRLFSEAAIDPRLWGARAAGPITSRTSCTSPSSTSGMA